MAARWRRLLVFAPLVIGLLVGCQSNDLTRDRAAEMLSERLGAAEVKIWVPKETLWCAQSAGLLRLGRFDTDPGCRSVYAQTCYLVTDSGQQQIKAFTEYPSGKGGADITFASPINRRLVEVTGITDSIGLSSGASSTAKQAEFTWRWNGDDIAGDIRACVVERDKELLEPKAGVAAFQLYDDGWRLLGTTLR